MAPFDPAAYNRPPIINTASGFALATALITAMPKGAPDMIRRSAKKLRADALALQVAWIAQDKVKPPDRRVADVALDTAWSALSARVDAYCMLPSDKYTLVQRAEVVHAELFGEGLAFVNLPYDEEWAESQKRITKINELGLAKDIEQVAGAVFLENLFAAHEAYGPAAGTTAPAEAVSRTSLTEPLRSLRSSIGRYARQWAAAAEDSPELLEMAQAALAPIDRLRERQGPAGAAAAETEEPVDPNTPVPDLPDDPSMD